MLKLKTSLIILFLSAGISFAQQGAPAGAPNTSATPTPTSTSTPEQLLENTPTLRGFDMEHLDSGILQAARDQWHANVVRYQIYPDLQAKRAHVSMQEVWPSILDKLKNGLDDADKLHMAVVITIMNRGLYVPDPKLSKSDDLARFWADESNLQMLKGIWKQIATICAGRKQVIWLDIVNEPASPKELPSYPKVWPMWAQQIIDVIRAIDPVHPIVIEPGPGGLCWGFSTFPRLKGEPIIYSFHQYEPHAYTTQGLHTIKGDDLKLHPYLQTGLPWPGTYNNHGGGWWDKNRIIKDLQPVFDFQRRNPGVRIYVGEFSVVRWAPSAPDYLRDCLDIFEQAGWDWTYHDFHNTPEGFNGWRLDYDDAYSDPDKPGKVANGLTDRGKVVGEYLQRNVVPAWK